MKKMCKIESNRIRQALAQGLFMNVAEYFKENDYRTVSNR